MTTGADLSALGDEHSVRPEDFDVVAHDGTAFDAGGPSGACGAEAASLPAGPLSPSSEITGTVVLDVPPFPGTVRYHPQWLTTGGE